MSDPTTVNKLATVVNDAIKVAMDGGEVAAEAAMVADLPWLGLPVIRTILSWFLGIVEGYFYSNAAKTATKIVIDLQVSSEVSKTNSYFQKAQDAVKSGDKNAIDVASKNLDAAFAALIHYDGSASP